MRNYAGPALVVAASLLVLQTSSAQTPTPAPLRPVEEPEAYDVYAAVLPFEFKAYLVQAETDKMQPCVRSGAEFERWRAWWRTSCGRTSGSLAPTAAAARRSVQGHLAGGDSGQPAQSL